MIYAALALYAVFFTVALWRAGFRAGAPRPAAAHPHPRPERILILGATGGTGRQLVAHALERGYQVTAFVRRPERLPLRHARLTLVQGDVLDPAAVESAVRGQHAVLSALGHKRWLGPTRILSDGTRNVLRAMETHGVRRFVCETSLGIGDSAGRLGLVYTLFVVPLVLPFYFWDKTRQERAIAASGADWVIVRPGALNDAGPRGSVRHGRAGSLLWTVRIARADVADFMLNQLESDAYLRAAPGVCW